MQFAKEKANAQQGGAMMKSLLRNLVIMIAAVVSGTAAAEKWNVATPYPDASYVTAIVREFAEEVRQKTNGEIDITVHSGASLYKLPEIKRAVQTGQIAAGELLLGALANEDAVFGIAMMPFLTRDLDDASELWEAARPFTESRFDGQGLKLLWGTIWPGQSLLTRKPVESFADLQGAKFRVQSPTTAELAERMGVTGVRVETADIPQAFLTGIIDGMYTSNETAATLSGWDYISYAYETNAWYPLNAIFMNLDLWNGLAEKHKAIIQEAAKAAEAKSWAQAESETIKASKLLSENGVKVVAPPEALTNEFRRIGEAMLEGWKQQAGPDGESILKLYEEKRAAN